MINESDEKKKTPTSKLYGFNYGGKMIKLLCESIVNFDFVRNVFLISFSFYFN